LRLQKCPFTFTKEEFTMNILLQVILAAMLLVFSGSSGIAGDKAKLGPCVRQCVQTFNPSLADSGADEFMAEDFWARECVQTCKGIIYEGDCNAMPDGCCLADSLDLDPDCQSGPPNPDPEPGTDPPPGIDPGEQLPPDPGEAGKATLEGIDSDGDGIRDDIQRYIALTYPDSQKTRAALRQAAIALQKIILESPDVEPALYNTELEARASECIRYIHPDAGREIDNMLLAEFLNTLDRSRAYLEYDAKLSGHVFGVKNIDEYRSSCSFEPDLMED
jgi:hypothetical protein